MTTNDGEIYSKDYRAFEEQKQSSTRKPKHFAQASRAFVLQNTPAQKPNDLPRVHQVPNSEYKLSDHQPSQAYKNLAQVLQSHSTTDFYDKVSRLRSSLPEIYNDSEQEPRKNILLEHSASREQMPVQTQDNNYYYQFIDQRKIKDDVSGSDKDKSVLRSTLEVGGAVVLALLFALLVRRYVFEPYTVPTGSMLETIQLNDTLIGEKVSILFQPIKQRDIVTFADPEDPAKTLIKRVIGLPGQTIDLRDGQVYIDNVLLSEPYTNGKPTLAFSDRWSANLLAPIQYPYTIPEDHYWMMGDNRTDSLDSRYFGSVPAQSITSKARIIIWPPRDVKLFQ